jgi:hypothetical protein
VQQQHGGTRPGRQAGAAQDWTMGSHVHFHAEFMPGERRLPIDRISLRSIESHGSRQFSAGVDLRTVFNVSFEINLSSAYHARVYEVVTPCLIRSSRSGKVREHILFRG